MSEPRTYRQYRKELRDLMNEVGAGEYPGEEQDVERLVDMLIRALYIPCISDESATRIEVLDKERCAKFDISLDEPVNWGSLGCMQVKQFADGSWLVIVDEASPGECPSLCRYITRHMNAWGYDVMVQTEW